MDKNILSIIEKAQDGTLLDPLPFVTLRYTEEVRKEYEARDEVMAR